MITRRMAGAALLGAGFVGAANAQENRSNKAMMQVWQELFTISQRDKKGVTFWVGGQAIGGLVLKVIGEEAVEVKNQTYSRLVIRLSSVDAVAIN